MALGVDSAVGSRSTRGWIIGGYRLAADRPAVRQPGNAGTLLSQNHRRLVTPIAVQTKQQADFELTVKRMSQNQLI